MFKKIKNFSGPDQGQTWKSRKARSRLYHWTHRDVPLPFPLEGAVVWVQYYSISGVWGQTGRAHSDPWPVRVMLDGVGLILWEGLRLGLCRSVFAFLNGWSSLGKLLSLSLLSLIWDKRVAPGGLQGPHQTWQQGLLTASVWGHQITQLQMHSRVGVNVGCRLCLRKPPVVLL